LFSLGYPVWDRFSGGLLLVFRRRTATSAPPPPPPFAVLSEFEAGPKKLFLWRFCAFLNKGSSKTPQKTFLEKVQVKNFLPKS
jgi:hypothetical protein